MFGREKKILESAKMLIDILLHDKELPSDLLALVDDAKADLWTVINKIDELNNKGFFGGEGIPITPASIPWEQGIEGWSLIPPCPGTIDYQHKWNDRTDIFPRKCKVCGYLDSGPPLDKRHLLEMRLDPNGGFEVFAREEK